MELIADTEALYEAIGDRISRRKYQGTISQSQAEKLVEFAQGCTEASGGAIRIRVFEQGADKVMGGIRNSYGFITGAKGYAAFLRQEDRPDSRLMLGYYGEQFILKATALGLGTCWLGGTFDKEAAKGAVGPEEGEILSYVTPLGQVGSRLSTKEKMIKMAAGSVSRLPLKKIVLNYDEAFNKSPKWIQRALEAAQIAPSSVNKQPWRFTIDLARERLGVTLGAGSHEIQDIGIAMAHIELVGRHYAQAASWASGEDNQSWWYGQVAKG